MKKIALYLVMGASILGCGSDDSRPGVSPGLGETSPQLPANPTEPPTNPNEPPTDSTTPPPNPNDTPKNESNELLSGVYTGTTSSNQGIEGLVDDNNRFWFIYSDEDGVSGFINSNDNNLKTNNGKFSEEGKDYSYNYKNFYKVTIAGEHKKQQSIEGTITELPSDIEKYSLNYDKTLSGKKHNLADVSNKAFSGFLYINGDADAVNTTINLNENGDFTGNSAGCEMTGKFKLSQSQRYFVSEITFGNEPCTDARSTYTGIALLNSDDKLLLLSTNKDKGMFFSSGT